MTIASEISRLQNAKADICTAIENKGVTVGDITLDNYACCIDEISTGGNYKFVDLFLVGGGGAGAYCRGGGGGAGGVIYKEMAVLDQDTYSIVIGSGGLSNTCYTCTGGNGGNSCFGDMVAYGGGGGGGECTTCNKGQDGGSGGGGGSNFYYYHYVEGGKGTMGQGNYGGGGQGCCMPIDNIVSGGGGGYGGMGGMAGATRCCNCAGRGGEGIEINFDGVNRCYAGGGGGATYSYAACGSYGGGNGGQGSNSGGSATTYGSGGGGTHWGLPGNGCQGIAIVRYPTDGSYGINCATGGTVTTCTINGTEYKIHTFTSDGTFTIVS